MPETSTPSVGESFANALLAKDWPRLENILDSEVDFRGLTPGRPWEASSAKDVIENVFAQWFEPSDDIYDTIAVTTDNVGDRERVVYRFRVRNPQGDYVCEQTAYFAQVSGRIAKLRILCSGFIPKS